MRAPLTAAFCLTLAVAAYAQPAPTSQDEGPAHIAFIEGAVDIVHDGVSERVDPPELLVEGDIVRTGNGRAEIVFGDGTLLHLDHSAQLEVLSPERLRLTEGRLILRISAAVRNAYHVDTPGGTVRMDARGEFGISAFRDERLEVSASRGTAEIDDGTQKVLVRAGEMATLAAPGARAQFQSFNSARWDSFAQWANDRSNGFATSVSAARLPSELRVYGNTLDQYGRWEYLNPYGFVWYPAVGVSWRPYYDGWWAHTRYGWTWRGRDRWAWPTHHYGRWGFNGASWYWIPSSGWGPAWVSWGVSAGYVSWSPLGWDGRPSIGFWSRRDHPAYGPRYDPWRGWTIVPRDQFGPRRPVRPRAIDGNRLDDTVRSTMILQDHGPGDAGFAVPRGSFSLPAPAGNARRDAPRVDRPGIVRRPQGGSTTPSVTTPAPGPAERRVTDAPEYTPFYSVPRVGTADRNRGDNNDTDRGGRVRATDPRPATGDNERPATTSPRSSGDDGANRAVPRGGVERSPRGGAPSTQDAAGSSDRGGSANRGGYVRGSGGSSGGGDAQGGRPGASDGGGARPRGGASSGGTSTGGGNSNGGNAGASGGARPGSGGGAVRRPR